MQLIWNNNCFYLLTMAIDWKSKQVSADYTWLIVTNNAPILLQCTAQKEKRESNGTTEGQTNQSWKRDTIDVILTTLFLISTVNLYQIYAAYNQTNVLANYLTDLEGR